MRNIDRAVAYAKQRGVEIPRGFDRLTSDELKSRLLTHYGVKVLAKTQKPALVDRLTLEFLLPQLTPAQRRRIRHCDDSSRSLRDRRGRKLQQRLSRRQRIWNRR